MHGVFSAFILIAIQMDPMLCNSNVIITQSAVISREGQSVRLECLTSRKTDDRSIKWGYVPSGTTNIKWLLSWSPGSASFTRMPGIETRFSGTKDWSGASKFALKIDNLRREDEVNYYCQSANTSVEQANDWCGCGTNLKVKPAIPSRPPSVDLLYLSPEKVSQQTGSKLACVVSGFYPETISVSWYIGSTQISSGISNSEALMEADESYTIISELAVSTFQWVSGFRYTCAVSHANLSSPIRKEVSTDDPIPPSIYVLPPTFEEINVKKTATIVCLAVGFYPESISFRWLVNNNQSAFSSQTLRPVQNTNGSYSSRSELRIAVEEWDSGSVYTCEIRHVSLSSPVRHSLRKRNDGYIQEPVVHLISPSFDADSAEKTVAMTCLVLDFYPVDISVTWRDENGPVDTGVIHFGMALGSNGNYRTVSQLTVSTAEWESNGTYWCEVKHVSLGQPTQRAVSKDLAVFEAVKTGGATGVTVQLWIVAVEGGLLLIIAVVILVSKKTSSFSRTGKR